MKIKELDLSKYSFKRICIATEHGTVFMPEGKEEKLFELFGEEEIEEAGIEAAESGWLKLCPVKYTK
jgi:hypothetical protein